MRSFIAAVALAASFVFWEGGRDGRAHAQTTQFKVLDAKICKGTEHNLSMYLGGRFGEFQEEIIEGTHDGQNVVWMLWRNQISGTWTLSTNDGTDDCIIAFGVGHQGEGIQFFIERVLTEEKGPVL